VIPQNIVQTYEISGDSRTCRFPRKSLIIVNAWSSTRKLNAQYEVAGHYLLAGRLTFSPAIGLSMRISYLVKIHWPVPRKISGERGGNCRKADVSQHHPIWKYMPRDDDPANITSQNRRSRFRQILVFRRSPCVIRQETSEISIKLAANPQFQGHNLFRIKLSHQHNPFSHSLQSRHRHFSRLGELYKH